MCGVFGAVSKKDEPIDMVALQRIAVNTMQRGAHAFGFAWIDAEGRLKCFKQKGRIVDHLGILRMARDAQLLIGHCRFATHGDANDNINNHPHPADGGWIVHNGVIGNYRDVIRKHALAPVSDCDSEVLGLLIERFSGKLIDRCVHAVLETSVSPLAMLGLWPRPGRIIAVRRGNPLHLGEAKGVYYLASLPDVLPGKVRALKDGKVWEFGSKED